MNTIPVGMLEVTDEDVIDDVACGFFRAVFWCPFLLSLASL